MSLSWLCNACGLHNYAHRVDCPLQVSTNKNYSNKDSALYVIGNNAAGQLGLNHRNQIKKLINWNKYNPSISVQQIYCARSNTVFVNYDKNIWISGYNGNGQCAINIRDKYILGCASIKYFRSKQIAINKICTNPFSSHIFWISSDNKLYGNGSNSHCQLGTGDNVDCYQPTHIQTLKTIIDASFARHYSIAISKPTVHDIFIVTYWLRLNKIKIPIEIVKLIELFANNKHILYSTEFSKYCGNGRGGITNNKNTKWKEIIDGNLLDTLIVKIKCGLQHTFFVNNNGSLYGCGRNQYGQLGVYVQIVRKPVLIPYFCNNTIRIRQIECGSDHNLAVDYNRNVYSWGYNYWGQCGDGTTNNVFEPKLITTLNRYSIIDIKCGSFHSYVKNNQNSHFLFGSNRYNETSIDESADDKIKEPICINDVVIGQIKCKSIRDVYVGNENTLIIVHNK